jgi:hypothetical protein
VPAITKEQKMQCLRNKYGRIVLQAVEDVRNELYLESFVTAERVSEFLGSNRNDPKMVGRLLDAYAQIHDVILEPSLNRINGKVTRLYRDPSKGTKIEQSPQKEAPF